MGPVIVGAVCYDAKVSSIREIILDLEGLKAWLPGRTTGFDAPGEAVQKLGLFEKDPP